MPDMTFNCPECGQELEAPDELAGEVVECPTCSAQIQIPGADETEADEAVEKPSPASILPAMDEPSNSCPECGTEMEPDAVLCVACGFHTGLGKKIDTDFA